MKLASLKDTKKLAKRFSKIIKNNDVIFLHGEVGAGKTTFARFFINNLEEQNKIKKSDILSPTFNIVYDYNIKNLKILHYDLYRLKNYNDILELGIFENSEKNIKIIEWPELIKPKPKNRIEVMFKYSKTKDNRVIRVRGFGKWKDYKFNEI